jgi:hypothetical protein
MPVERWRNDRAAAGELRPATCAVMLDGLRSDFPATRPMQAHARLAGAAMEGSVERIVAERGIKTSATG